jgi:DNA polymerase-4
VAGARRRRSLGSQSALGRARHDPRELEIALLAIVDRVGRRLRADERVARTLTLRVRFADSERITRSASLDVASDANARFAQIALGLLRGIDDLVRARGVTLVGLTCSNLEPVDPRQLTLPFPRAGRVDHRLDAALDAVQARFGNASLTRGVLVGDARLRHSFGEALVEPAAPRDTPR